MAENMADADVVETVKLVSFENALEEDCEVTIIDECSTSERTVGKCCRSVVWCYFNKLPGKINFKKYSESVSKCVNTWGVIYLILYSVWCNIYCTRNEHNI